MALRITKENTFNIWTHIDDSTAPDTEIILSKAYVRLADSSTENNMFELTEQSGSDNFRVGITDIIVKDNATGTPDEFFTTALDLITRLRELDYPYFDDSVSTTINIDDITVQNNGTTLITGAATLNFAEGLTATGTGTTKTIRADVTGNIYTTDGAISGEERQVTIENSGADDGSITFVGANMEMSLSPDSFSANADNWSIGANENGGSVNSSNNSSIEIIGRNGLQIRPGASGTITPSVPGQVLTATGINGETVWSNLPSGQVGTLQQVTDEGSTTDNSITVGETLTVGSGTEGFIVLTATGNPVVSSDGGSIRVSHETRVNLTSPSVTRNDNEILSTAGSWNASDNTPPLSNSDTGQIAVSYTVSAAGTVDFGLGPITFGVNDQVSNNGVFWFKSVDNNQGGGSGGITPEEREVLGVADITYELYDVAEDQTSRFWDTDGTLLTINGRSVSAFYPVSEGEYVNVYTDSGTVSFMALLDVTQTYVAGLRTIFPSTQRWRFKVPAGISFISWNTTFSNITRTSNYFKSEFDITTQLDDTYLSGLSGTWDNWRANRLEFQDQLKGRSIAPDPFFENFDILTQFIPISAWPTTTVTPIGILNNGNYTISKVTDLDTSANPRISSASTGLQFSRNYDNNLRDLNIKIDSVYLTGLGVVNGDSIRVGFWVKMDIAPNRPINFFFNDVQQNAVTDTTFTWVESIPMVFDSGLSHLEIPLSLASYENSSVVAESFVMTGLTVLNVTNDLWLGYEENENFIIEKAASDAVGDDITEEINQVLETNKTIFDTSVTQNYGGYVTNFRRELRTMIPQWNKPADEVRIVFFGDSILFGTGGAADQIGDWFLSEYGVPKANTNLNSCWGGYSTNEYLRTVESSVIFPNVDLVVLSEVGFQDGQEQMIQFIQARTNADIVIGTWTNYQSDPPFETDAQYYQLRDMAHSYGCEVWDINAILERAQIDGTQAPLYRDDLHLSALGITTIVDDFKLHIQQERIYNEYNTNQDIKNTIIQAAPDFNIPLNSITYSGSWSGAVGGGFLTSSTNSDSISIPFTGTGIEVLFDDNSGTANAGHNILLDSAAPSAYTRSNGEYLEYCTQLVGKTQTEPNWQFHRFFKAEVTLPFLTNNETEVEFEIVIDSITRNPDTTISGIGYTLRIDDGGFTNIGTGNINADATFTVRTTGQVRIPAQVFGLPNFLEMPDGDPDDGGGSGFVFNVGDTIQFFARKTWKDSFTSSEGLLRIAGLDRGAHTLEITKSDTTETRIQYFNIYK